MANKKQLEILKQGVKNWNIWRIENRDVEIDLSKADLKGAKLHFADLNNVNLQQANLSEAYLVATDLGSTDLSGANLSNAVLGETNLQNAILINANLSGAIILLVNFNKADLRGADFTEAKIWWNAVFGENDLSTTIGLETIEHGGSSTIGTNTIQMSKGNIPIEFLRGCGLTDLDIEYAKLAIPGLDEEQVTQIIYEINRIYCDQPIQYYSCFISYSNKDLDFAKRVHDDLQNNGVRCWLATEDMKIGDEFRKTIGQQIRLRDKLLIILSENSIQSEWVGDEVEKALAEEKEQGTLKLFPINLDNAVFKTNDDWAEKIRLRRHIGDFSSDYDKAFTRLLRDLKSQ
jgi:uncharacterized protein YjbI with pentapeptide repeats